MSRRTPAWLATAAGHRPIAASAGSPPDVPALLTPDEVAAALRTSRKAIYAMIARQQLPGIVRLGRRVLVRADALVDWLRQKSAPSLER